MLRFSFSFGSLHLEKWQTPQMHALTASVAAMSGKWVLFPTSTSHPHTLSTCACKAEFRHHCYEHTLRSVLERARIHSCPQSQCSKVQVCTPALQTQIASVHSYKNIVTCQMHLRTCKSKYDLLITTIFVCCWCTSAYLFLCHCS